MTNSELLNSSIDLEFSIFPNDKFKFKSAYLRGSRKYISFWDRKDEREFTISINHKTECKWEVKVNKVMPISGWLILYSSEVFLVTRRDLMNILQDVLNMDLYK